MATSLTTTVARWTSALAIAALMVAANVAAWRWANPPLPATDAPPTAAGMAYNGFQRFESPLTQRYPTEAELDADLELLARHTRRLRTYSAAEQPSLPQIAQRHGIKLAVGAWLDERIDNNDIEINAALDVARHDNVERIIVGNETQLHGKLTPQQLYDYLDRVRTATRKPVSTAEPWHIWLRQPELARHVDFITVHLLPYWEGVPVEAALDEALLRYAQVQARFPRKRVVIGEIGWPSGGKPVGVALATPDAQARFIRAFLARTAGSQLDYYLMEAVDQPWKRATEGAVGAHWGMFDAQRRAKFDFAGPIDADPYWRGKALAASLLGLAAMLPFLLKFGRMRLAGRLLFAGSAQAVASFAVLLATLPLAHYLRPQDVLLLAVLVPALVLLAAILLAQVFEFAEVFWDGSLHRRAPPKPLPAGAPALRVSIHLACCNEPPEMVIATIDSLLALDWPDFEVIVVDNNTRDASLWQPVQAHVARRAAELPADGRVQLRFFHLPQWPGYKAGALNYALRQTDARAEWIAVVDADYVVRRDWLRQIGGYFTDAAVGIVQAPQAHREWAGQRLARMMNWEYEGFFRIGMHHRHERDAIVQHGTMTAIRADALRAAGWAEDCVCEDTELGLRLLAGGLRAVYVDRVFGTGLVPADFGAYWRQRRRWAQGAMQILRRHATALAGLRPLRNGLRYHFVAGWLPWVGDLLHLFFTLAALFWSLGVLAAPQWFSLPIGMFVAPVAVFFVVRLLLGPLLYWRRVGCGAADIAGAAVAGMGLSHSVARGMWAGLTERNAVFEITRKAAAGAKPRSTAAWWAPVREEALLLAALLAAIGAFALERSPLDRDAGLWMLVLAMQALPYAAALLCARVSPRTLRPRAQPVAAPQPLAAADAAA